MKTKTTLDLTETITELLDSIQEIEVSCNCEDEDGWPIPDWELEDREDEIETSKVVVSVILENDDRSRDQMISRSDEIINQVREMTSELGINLVEQRGQMLIKGGGYQIDYDIISK